MRWWDDGNGGRRFGIDVGVADYNRDGDEAEKENEIDGIEMANLNARHRYSTVSEVDDSVSVDIAESQR